LSGAGQIVLRQVGAVHGRRIVSTDDGQMSVITLATEHVSRREPSGTPAHNHDRIWSAAQRLRSWRSNFLANEDLVSDLLHSPTGNWIESRRAQRLACAQAETGVVPPTAHRISNHQALGERSSIVRAVCADGEQLRAVSQQYDLFAVHGAHHVSIVGKTCRRDPLFQVRFLSVVHIDRLDAILLTRWKQRAIPRYIFEARPSCPVADASQPRVQ